MPIIRAFIAVNISPEIQRRLGSITKDLQRELKGIGVRWVPVENIHITLKFLGDVSTSNLEVLKDLLQVEASGISPFEITAAELGAFPSNRKARVIWVGIQAPAELAALQQRIENQTARLGYAREDRPFSPHLTLGRVSRNVDTGGLQRIGDVISNYKTGFIGKAGISAVYLYRSDLQPSGAVYTSLFSARFNPTKDTGSLPSGAKD
jgi:2'-5' RNA ligase